MAPPRHILITGASSGLGAALALDYAAPGVRLSLHGRNTDRLKAVTESAKVKGAVVTIHTGDVTDAEGLKGWITQCDAQQPIDLIIANAGISGGTGGGRESEEQSRTIFSTNLTGVLNTVHPVLPLMLQRKRGQIAIVSSIAGFYGFPGAPAYCASKAAVRMYGEALRGDVRNKGVSVNVICPGFVKTPMTEVNRFAMPFIMSAERAAKIIRKGLEADRVRIAFPLPMYLGVRLLAALPQGLTELFAGIFPKKGK